VDLAHPRRQGSRQLWIWSSYMELGTSRSWGVGGSRGGDPSSMWIWFRAGVWHSWGAGIPVVHGTGMAQEAGVLAVNGSLVGLGPSMAWGAGILVVSGSSAELWPGTARGAESPVERSSDSAGLWGGALAGRLFFY
jgi:hypothetical protein